ncbi:hypothetical protein B0H17DRAFT_1048798 [Mycena rosella]|uniref:CipC protein n=1 Tax=Mycena rosella TaxID=1033263 RepID=A0AAD7DXE5_MYCRO|nr:hypothetical protein B0H17DRAFT_1048798 [Mycena rosella]
MPFWHHHDDEKAYHEVLATEPEHKAKISHELIAGAAAFEAAKKYEEHCKANGKPESHAMAKELIAGFTGAFIDRMVETKGLDELDTQKAKHEAAKRAHERSEVVLVEQFN